MPYMVFKERKSEIKILNMHQSSRGITAVTKLVQRDCDIKGILTDCIPTFDRASTEVNRHT